jgi:rubrerythrin
MEKSNTLNILKNAFLMERPGKSLYETARDKADDEAVKNFFDDLANEEAQHMKMLEALQEDLKQRIWEDNSFWLF